MTTEVYVNFVKEIIASEKEAEAIIKEQANEFRHDQDLFNDWLSDNYSGFALFMADEKEKKNITKDYENYCCSKAREEFMTYWDKFEIEI